MLKDKLLSLFCLLRGSNQNNLYDRNAALLTYKDNKNISAIQMISLPVRI